MEIPWVSIDTVARNKKKIGHAQSLRVFRAEYTPKIDMAAITRISPIEIRLIQPDACTCAYTLSCKEKTHNDGQCI